MDGFQFALVLAVVVGFVLACLIVGPMLFGFLALVYGIFSGLA